MLHVLTAVEEITLKQLMFLRQHPWEINEVPYVAGEPFKVTVPCFIPHRSVSEQRTKLICMFNVHIQITVYNYHLVSTNK